VEAEVEVVEVEVEEEEEEEREYKEKWHGHVIRSRKACLSKNTLNSRPH
jgi:hypothetical protein